MVVFHYWQHSNSIKGGLQQWEYYIFLKIQKYGRGCSGQLLILIDCDRYCFAPPPKPTPPTPPKKKNNNNNAFSFYLIK